MIDLHMHTLASDGELLPSELVRRAQAAGYRALAITDHADESNLEELLRRARAAAEAWGGEEGIRVLPGVELTHVPPARIAPLAARARELGAAVVVVHGETVTEPVAPGTNAAAIACPQVDILAHPGLLTAEDAAAAASSGVMLEITARRGHSVANGRVASVAVAQGAPLVINTDAHAPGDIITPAWARTVLAAAGLTEEQSGEALANAEKLLHKACRR